MRTIGFVICCLGSGVLHPAPLLAQGNEIPARLSLDETVRLVEQRHPSLAAARARLAAADAAVGAARQRPNPVVGLSSEGYRPWAGEGRSADELETVVEVTQEIETAGRRRLRTAAASAGTAATRAMAEDWRRRVRLDAERAYFQLVLARSETESAAAALAEVDTVIRINRTRYEQGEVAGGELRRLEVERMRFTDDLVAAQLSEKNARAALLSMLGSGRLDAPLEPTDALGPASASSRPAPGNLDAPALIARAMAARPDLGAARQQEARARSEWQLQRALRFPTLTLGAGYRRDYGQNGLALSASVPLPLFDRNAAGVARAEAERRLAASDREELERGVSLEVQQAVNAVEAIAARLAALESQYLTQAREARDSALAAYRAGATGLIDYLDAQRSFREVQRTHQRALFDHRLSLAQLDAVVGTTTGDVQP